MSQAFLFYYDGQLTTGEEVALPEDEAKHIVQVLRKKEGDVIQLTNGRGASAAATIIIAHKKKCHIKVDNVQEYAESQPFLHLAVAFTKNNNRNEWILEKATELGVKSIIPLNVKRSERNKFRYDRWKTIITSATMQSQQYYLPELTDAMDLDEVISSYADVPEKVVAHCMENLERVSINDMQKQKETLLLIGPEGDFTEEEVNTLTSNNFKAMTLGKNRLRTETAAVTVCAYFNMINHG